MPGESSPPDKYVLVGDIVTMDAGLSVIEGGSVYIDSDEISAVAEADEPLQPGFDGVPVIDTKGSIYPGLIDIHNHLSYNMAPLKESIPSGFTSSDSWKKAGFYKQGFRAPVEEILAADDISPAVTKYVECKCLLAGVTTTQGFLVAFRSVAADFLDHYRGLVRNVEAPGRDDLTEATTRIPPLGVEDVAWWCEQKLANTSRCVLHHLSEGIDPTALSWFEVFWDDGTGEWRITSALAGIHCLALEPEHFDVMARHGCSMVWSPFSNMLLYGDARVADVRAAADAGIDIALGPDWSWTGSKSLHGELKVAHLINAEMDLGFGCADLVKMATSTPAKILKWGDRVGSIEEGKIADLMVVSGQGGDHYDRLLRSAESDIIFVAIDGVPRWGDSKVMESLGIKGESWRVGSRTGTLHLNVDGALDGVNETTLGEAQKRLAEVMGTIEKHAAIRRKKVAGLGVAGRRRPSWRIVAEPDEPPSPLAARRRLRRLGTSRSPLRWSRRFALSPYKGPDKMRLDPLTVVDDPEYFQLIDGQANVAQYLKDGLPDLY
jgi:5-methylthioadenosine/S-adenosylhomocysteine deaminase